MLFRARLSPTGVPGHPVRYGRVAGHVVGHVTLSRMRGADWTALVIICAPQKYLCIRTICTLLYTSPGQPRMYQDTVPLLR